MHVAFLLFDGFSNMVLSCLLEPLRAVRDQSAQDISWRVLTPDDQPVRSSSGLTIAPDMNCTDAGPLDILAVVAGYGFRDHALGSGPRRIAALARQARVLVGADAGAWLIAAAGLFDGRQRATLHWSLLADFAETFPHVPVASDRHIKEGRIWTCGGAASALDLTLAIIDEIGFTDVDVYEAALLSTGKRPGSKLVAIGTPSTPRMRDKSPLLGLVTAGRAGDPTINLVEYSAPDNCALDDEEALAAANPALGDWLDLDVIRASMPPKTSEAEYRRARLGQWVLQSGESFMPAEAWGECARPGVAIPEGTPVVLALDGSQRWDATVLMMASVSPVPHVEVAGWWFGDHDPDFEVSHAEVENTILDFAERFKVREVTADPYLWQRTLQVLQEEGLPVSKFSQSAGRMSPALAEFRAAALDGKVTHQDDHRVNAHMLAAQLIESGHGMKLGKPSKEMHIDGAVATVMAYSRAFWLGSKRLKKKNKSYRR